MGHLSGRDRDGARLTRSIDRSQGQWSAGDLVRLVGVESDRPKHVFGEDGAGAGAVLGRREHIVEHAVQSRIGPVSPHDAVLGNGGWNGDAPTCRCPRDPEARGTSLMAAPPGNPTRPSGGAGRLSPPPGHGGVLAPIR